jgi:hypothetical protein
MIAFSFLCTNQTVQKVQGQQRNQSNVSKVWNPTKNILMDTYASTTYILPLQ